MVKKTMGIKPYYETELGQLYCGRCEDVLPKLEQIGLVLTDPPYGVKIGGAKGIIGGANIVQPKIYGECLWDKKRPSRQTFDLILSISKNQIIFGGNYFIDYLYPTPCFLVWNKDNGNSNFADCELAWTSFKTATRIIKYRWNGCMKEAPETRYHPTQKPVGLFAWILDRYSKPTDTILDCFAGSGTAGLACERLNRKWIMIEKEEEYCQIIKARIKQETSQLKLFR